MQILSGTKVLDITRFISGSRCTRILGDMGDEVIKVEPPQGEYPQDDIQADARG